MAEAGKHDPRALCDCVDCIAALKDMFGEPPLRFVRLTDEGVVRVEVIDDEDS